MKFKQILSTISFSLMAISGVSQDSPLPDKVYKTDNTVIESKVIEITRDEIKYKRANHLDGPLYSISKGLVVMIVYSNGVSEVIEPGPGGTAGLPDAAATAHQNINSAHATQIPYSQRFGRIVGSGFINIKPLSLSLFIGI